MTELPIELPDRDALDREVDRLAHMPGYGYPWIAGVLIGALRHGWTVEETAAFLEESHR